jgi:hypothetical protein
VNALGQGFQGRVERVFHGGASDTLYRIGLSFG